MGKFSRMKGRRNEQQLVLYLAKRGYKAERILRQYQSAGQPDVKAEKDGKTTTFEMKARRDSFKSIYATYYSERDERGVLAFVLNSGGVAVAMSTELEDITGNQVGYFFNTTLCKVDKKITKVLERIVKLKELKQEADYLVIKDNNQNPLFIRYWG